MARFTRRDRARIIEGYLAATGRETFHAGEFVDWLQGEPTHEAYEWFFGQDDETMAREFRIQLARRFAAGIRIVTAVSSAPVVGTRLNIQVREFPALVSPIESRKAGGGYTAFDPREPGHLEVLEREAITSLKAWLRRYRGALEELDYDLSTIEGMVADDQEPEARTA